MAYTILIADDHSIVRHGTKLLIEEMFPDAIVLEANSLKQITLILKNTKVDLAILDINMPGGNSVQLVDAVKMKQDDLKILIFSAYEEKLYATRYLQAGASGYLQKHTSEQELKSAIYAILDGKQYMSEILKTSIFETMIVNNTDGVNPITLLSNREIEVAELIMQGMGGIEIAAALNIETTTVSSHKKRVFDKLKVSNLAEFIEKFKHLSGPGYLPKR